MVELRLAKLSLEVTYVEVLENSIYIIESWVERVCCNKGGRRLYLTEREKEGLFIVVAANLAKKRMQEGVKLNYPEAVAIITYEIREMARRGNKTVPELEEIGRKILTEEDVMEGIASMINQINIEATFPDGTKLIVVPDPIQPKSRME